MANSIELATFDWRRRHVPQADRLLDFVVCVRACACDVNQQLVRKSRLAGSAKKNVCVCVGVGVGVGVTKTHHLSSAWRFLSRCDLISGWFGTCRSRIRPRPGSLDALSMN